MTLLKTKKSIHTKKFKKMFGELRKDLNNACWSGYKQVGMKKKGNKQVPNCVPEDMSIEDAMKVDGYIPESYEIGMIMLIILNRLHLNEKEFMKPVDAKKRYTR